MEIAPNKGMHALPPTRRIAPVVHAPGEGDGQNWPLASAGIGRGGRNSAAPATHFTSDEERELDKSAE